jgi:hypothetical protein
MLFACDIAFEAASDTVFALDMAAEAALETVAIRE